MAKTQIADIIVPEEFEKYTQERTAELNRFGASGILKPGGPMWDAYCDAGGRIVDLPFFQDISPTRQIPSDSADLSLNKIAAIKQLARVQTDAQAWSVNQLAAQLAGADPVAALVQIVGAYWARVEELQIIKSIDGLRAAAAIGVNSILSESIAGQSSATKLNGSTFIDSTVKLGDASEKLTHIAMHSDIEAALRKLDLITYLPDSTGKPIIKTFQGRTVIVDDTMLKRAGTTDGNVYTSVLFGQGAFVKGNGNLGGAVQGGFGSQAAEFSRAALGNDTLFINRRRYILHPDGVSFTSTTVVGESPTDAELARSDNWTRKKELKNIPIVAIVHN